MFANDHSFGISPVSFECWKGGQIPNLPVTDANSFWTLGWSSSGHKTVDGFKPSRSFVTPSLVTQTPSMNVANLSRRGT